MLPLLWVCVAPTVEDDGGVQGILVFKPFFAELLAEAVDYIYDVVAGALQVADDIHIVYAGLVCVVLFVDVLHVCVAQSVAHIVYLAFLVVRLHQRTLAYILNVAQLAVHQLHCLFDVVVHGVDVVIDFVVEFGVAFDFSSHYFADTQTAVGNASISAIMVSMPAIFILPSF